TGTRTTAIVTSLTLVVVPESKLSADHGEQVTATPYMRITRGSEAYARRVASGRSSAPQASLSVSGPECPVSSSVGSLVTRSLSFPTAGNLFTEQSPDPGGRRRRLAPPRKGAPA